MVNSLMFGTKIGRLLKNSGKKERIQFWFASMVTVTATLLYTMFAFGLSDITNDSLSKNDVQQLQQRFFLRANKRLENGGLLWRNRRQN